MRLTTLAIRNIKRNFPKYVIYVLSLSFSVFTAYSFLALIYNDHVRTAFTYDDRYQSLLYGFGTIIIIFVVFFLISSNNSFINARKKEISTYSLFGMTNGKIANLLFLETIFIGMISLIFGIATGMFFSKLMAMLLLNIALSTFTGELTFSIAPQAVYMTAMIFVATFCLMGVSGLWVINKFQLVDLFKAEKVSEGKSKGSYIILVLSVLMIGYGYYLATESNPMALFKYFLPVLLLVISGTYLFFWSGLPKV